MKKILIINDYKYVTGGADRVALAMYNKLSSLQNVSTYFFGIDNYLIKRYPYRIANFHKNIFNFGIYFKLKEVIKISQPDIILIHSWTKQLSPSIFVALGDIKTYVIAHDYFLTCPNGGYFNYKSLSICQLKGGSFSCFRCNCDKESYLMKLFRFSRFQIQSAILTFNSSLVVTTLNDLQVKKINKKFSVLSYLNEIAFPEYLSGPRTEVAFVGRTDPEKGALVVRDLPLLLGRRVTVIGDGSISLSEVNGIDSFGWLDDCKLAAKFKDIRVAIFPSIWHEVDPLTPWEMMSKGIPVISSFDNLFGKRISLVFPELVYHSISEIPTIIEKLNVDSVYYRLCDQVLEYVKTEYYFRIEANNKFYHEIIN